MRPCTCRSKDKEEQNDGESCALFFGIWYRKDRCERDRNYKGMITNSSEARTLADGR